MKQFAGFKSEAPAAKYPMLPAGTYVAGIRNVKVDGAEPDQQLILRLDIIEGPEAGYYTKRYEHESGNTSGNYPVRYKGDFRIQIPDPNNTKRPHPEWDLRSFNNAMWAIEQSNPGYKWDWNEAGLKGKIVGINVRESTYNSNLFTKIGRLEDANAVRAGTVKTLPPQKEKEDKPVIDAASGMPMVATEDLPF